MGKPGAIMRISKITLVILGLVIATVAALFFISGIQSYLEGDHSDVTLANIVLSIGLICFLLAILFGYKAASKYLIPTPNYQVPESPTKTVLYITLTGGFVITTAVALIVFLFYLNA